MENMQRNTETENQKVRRALIRAWIFLNKGKIFEAEEEIRLALNQSIEGGEMWTRNRKKNKYAAQKTADGFPSKLEAAVYQILKMRERAGEIKNIQRQASVDLGFGITWKLDFCFEDCATGKIIYAEAKGFETETYLLKRRMWMNGAGPGRLEIWKGTYTNPQLHSVIDVKSQKGDETTGGDVAKNELD